MRRELVRVVGGVRIGGEHSAGLRVEHDDAAALARKRQRGGGLRDLRQRQHDRADGLLVREHVREVLQLEVERPALEIGRVRLLDADRAVLDRLVAHDVGEERRGCGRVDALVLVLVVGRDGLGDDDTIGGLDRTAVAPDVGEELPRVAARIRELLAAHDLEVGELRDEDREQHEHRDAHPADPRIHRAPAGVGGGSERIASSDRRNRMARSAKLATSDDPP